MKATGARPDQKSAQTSHEVAPARKGPRPPQIVVIARVPGELKSEGVCMVGSYQPILLDNEDEEHGGDVIRLRCTSTSHKVEDEVEISGQVRILTANGSNGTAVEIIGVQIFGFLKTLGKAVAKEQGKEANLATSNEPLPIPRGILPGELVTLIHEMSAVVVGKKEAELLLALAKSDLGKTRLEIRKDLLEYPSQ